MTGAISPPWLPDPNRLLRAALFAILGVMLVSGVSWWMFGLDGLAFLRWMPGCAIRSWTGLPCPGCGMGHALIYLSRFQWDAAVEANPAAPCLAAAMLVGALRQAPDRAVCGAHPLPVALCLAAVVAAWLWRIAPLAGVSAAIS